jgi:hypothetical protein
MPFMVAEKKLLIVGLIVALQASLKRTIGTEADTRIAIL